MKKVIVKKFTRGSDLASCRDCNWDAGDRFNVGLKCRKHTRETGHKVTREYNVAFHYILSPEKDIT